MEDGGEGGGGVIRISSQVGSLDQDWIHVSRFAIQKNRVRYVLYIQFQQMCQFILG